MMIDPLAAVGVKACPGPALSPTSNTRLRLALLRSLVNNKLEAQKNVYSSPVRGALSMERGKELAITGSCQLWEKGSNP